MCYPKPGPRCANHTRNAFQVTKNALIASNEKLDSTKHKLSKADAVQAEAKLMNNDRFLSLAIADHEEASRNYKIAKAIHDEKAGEHRISRDAYLETAEGIQALRDAGKTLEAEKYAAIREMKLEELKRVEAAKGETANPAVRAVIEQPVPDLTGKSIAELESMSEQEDMRPEVLDAMLSLVFDNGYGEKAVAELVACHELTSVRTLDDLSRYTGDNDVRRYVAEHPSIHPKTLTRLATDEDPKVRAGAAGNPRMDSINMLRHLAKDPEKEVRKMTASNPNTPAAVLSELARDENPSVASTAIKNERQRKLAS